MRMIYVLYIKSLKLFIALVSLVVPAEDSPVLAFVIDPRVSAFLPMLRVTLWSDFIKGTHTEKTSQAILLNPNSHHSQGVAKMARCPSRLWRGPLYLPAWVQIVSFGNIHGTSAVGRPECGPDCRRLGPYSGLSQLPAWFGRAYGTMSTDF